MMDLKPCWCGGAARRVDIDDESENAGASFIECTRCGNTTNLEFGRKENLLDRWNTRPREDALQAEVERLRTLVAGGLEAVSAAYQQALAEAQNHDRIADKHDKVVMAWKREARATLKGAPHG